MRKLTNTLALITLLSACSGAPHPAALKSPEPSPLPSFSPSPSQPTPSSSPSALLPDFKLGSVLSPKALPRLPWEGLAVEPQPHDGSLDTVVLVGLNGRVYGNFPGFTLHGLVEAPGPLFLRSPDGSAEDPGLFLLSPGATSLKSVVLREGDYSQMPLAYGAVLTGSELASPGGVGVKRNGKILLSVENLMTSSFAVSYRRDIVTRHIFASNETKQSDQCH
jgi:hypothetical protein